MTSHSLNKACKLLVAMCVLHVSPLHAHRLHHLALAHRRVLLRMHRRADGIDWFTFPGFGSTPPTEVIPKTACVLALIYQPEPPGFTDNNSDSHEAQSREFLDSPGVTPPVRPRKRKWQNLSLILIRSNKSSSSVPCNLVRSEYVPYEKSNEPVATAILLI